MPEMTTLDALAFIAEAPRTAKLAFNRPNGQPVVLPVWIAVDGDTVVFNTGETTAKGRAIKREPRVAICVDDERPPFSFVTIEGTAELIDDIDEVRHWAAIIGGRYMGADRADEFGDRNGVPGELLVRVTPTKVIGFRDMAD
jgi:PPOX class probable F420-dependent enzyme